MRNLWKKLLGILAQVRRKYLYLIIAGLLVGAFSALVLNMGAWCFWPMIFIAFIGEAINLHCNNKFDWVDFAVQVGSSLVISLFVLF